MRTNLGTLGFAAAVVLGALAAGCGGNQGYSTPTPSTSPAATPALVPPASPGERVTFYGRDAGDSAGAMAAGDFNGDTIQDIILTAALGDGPDNARPDAGEAYVFLGPFTPGEERDPAQGQHDLVIYGARAEDQLGRALTAGDLNGDGVDDIALGAPFADGPEMSRPDAGQVYILYGSSRLGDETQEVDLARGGPDAVIFGADAGDLAGFALHAADVNGDGLADLIIGAFWADGPDNDRPNAGEVYVVYGSNNRIRFDLAMNEQDVTILGAETEDRLGEGVGAGDVDGDGRADLIVSATFADGPNNDREAAGETYIILAPPATIVDIAKEQQDVAILGLDPGDQIGHSITSGDVNGDGLADLLLGALSADGPGNREDLAGEAYLLLGEGQPPEFIDVAADGAAALVYGPATEDRLGRSAAMGDVNGDGLSDLIIAAPGAAGNGPTARSGAIYILFARGRGPYANDAARADVILEGLDAGDSLGYEVFGTPPLATADLNGDRLADILVTAPRADGPDNQRRGCGEAYIIVMEEG